MTTACLEVEGHSMILDLLKSASALSSPTLDLSRRNISDLPDVFPPCPRLECLYLEGNHLTSLPPSLFIQCPALRWLDLRNNALVTISASIQNLKFLRTLLLEGNNLISLPYQLGKLRRLNGLSLSGNPLQCPPKYLIQQGTKTVLEYLRDMLDEDNDKIDESGESSDEDNRVHLEPLHLKKYLVSDHQDFNSRAILMKQATLHTSRTPHQKPLKYSKTIGLENKKSEEKTRKTRKNHLQNKFKKDQETKEKIDKELTRERNKQCLEEWRDETKRLQDVQLHDNNSAHPQASDVAPFATNKENNLKHDETTTPSLLSGDHNFTSSEQSDVIVTEWTKQYVRQLQQTREKGGLLTSPPSSQLLTAELKLAEALAMRKQFEAQRARNYRLRAFTGDSLF